MLLLQLLSLSVNVLCLVQKLPQIIRIYQTKNVTGISVSSVLLEETAYTLMLTYNLWKGYPLSAFFEYIFLFAQDILLLFALAKYSVHDKDKRTSNPSQPIYGIIIFCLYLIASLQGWIPVAWMDACTIAVIPISASSKIIQLKTIIANRSAGQVSGAVWFIAAYGSFARVITNFYETQDMKMVANLFISLLLNSAIALACTIYGSGPAPKSANEQRKKTT